MSDLHRASRSQQPDQAIHALLAVTPQLEAAAMVSFDGLPMASVLPPSEPLLAAVAAVPPFPRQSTPATLPSWGAYAPSGSVPPQAVLPDSAPWS